MNIFNTVVIRANTGPKVLDYFIMQKQSLYELEQHL